MSLLVVGSISIKDTIVYMVYIRAKMIPIILKVEGLN